MQKLFSLALIGALSLTGAAYAQDQADINADVGAIHKDNAALSKDQQRIEKDRADKEAAKAHGDAATQAGKSVAIGADQTMKGEKKVEKSIDQKILEHHENDVDADGKVKSGGSY